jgi:hypothetical protein
MYKATMEVVVKVKVELEEAKIEADLRRIASVYFDPEQVDSGPEGVDSGLEGAESGPTLLSRACSTSSSEMYIDAQSEISSNVTFFTDAKVKSPLHPRNLVSSPM